MVEIYGTLGPRCADEETLRQMFLCGMTGVRLNLSHTTLRQAEEMLRTLQRAAAACGITPRLLMDMQGPELRLGDLENPVLLTAGEEVSLGTGGLPVPESVYPWLKPGQPLLLDDGKLLLEVTGQGKNSASARVIRGGDLRGRKSIALPESDILPPALTQQDRENIRDAARFGVTGIMQPFVRSADDLITVKEALQEAECPHIRLFAKIENMVGVNRLESLLPECDEIVIARGDLGNAMPLWELPRVQKEIAALCRARGKPFMVVTQMLASMERSPVPTRAEVSDIYNAVLDGAASVMVTGETAVGDYPAETIRYLANTAREAWESRCHIKLS